VAMTVNPDAIEQVLDDAEELVTGLLGIVELLRRAVVDAAAAGLPLAPDSLILGATLRNALRSGLECVDGAGFAFAPGVVAGTSAHLEWWFLGQEDRQPRLRAFDEDPRSPGFYDYAATVWYQVAERVDRPRVTGPYVDALGTDANVITLSAAARAKDLLGVACLDISVASIEQRFSAGLRRIDHKAALINAERRVIASTSEAHLPGCLVDASDTCSEPGRLTGWSIVTAGPRR
jgi:hypothetical protein